ncbi:MAG: M3 family metallopeptidase [Dermabacter sp.]|nr:M3 family metallopeptidase [Dermabacter sp.]
MTAPSTGTAANPLTSLSPLPYHLPDFAAIRDEHYLEAITEGIAEARAAYSGIAESSDEPTFANVIAVLDQPSRTLNRAVTVFYNQVSSDGTESLLAIESEVSALLAQLSNELHLNPAIFARLDAVHTARHEAGLTAEQIALTEKFHRDFTLAGAALSDADRERLAALNLELSAAETEYSQQVTRDINAAAVLITDEAELAGLGDAQIAAARRAADEAGHADGWLLTLILPTTQPLLESLERRDVRERLLTASFERGDATWQMAARIAALRAKKAALLGYEDFAALAVASRTARTPSAVDGLFAQTIAPAMANADREAAIIAARAREDGIEDLAPWDWSYYSEKVKAEQYAVDTAQLRPYFVLDRVLEDGVFYAAERVYGITFKRREDLVGYHPEARIWEVFDADGSGLGLFVGDFFTRDTKRGGAWMNTLVDQSLGEGTKPIVVNNLNISAPAPGGTAFVSLDETRTLFHEFGHALHGLFSSVEYESLSGLSVERDIVEYPSQVNEMWMLHPEILPNYARHVETGEVVPADLIEKVRAADMWGEGFGTVEYLQAAALDWAWHRRPAALDAEPIEDPVSFETAALEEAGLLHPLVQTRYRTSYLNHTFSGGYAAGYYSYLWAEVFDADTVAWYEDNGGLTRESGQKFRDHILAIGSTLPIPEAFVQMTGREARIEPLLERRGLTAR